MPLLTHQLVAAATSPTGPAGRRRLAYLARPGNRLTVAEQRLLDDLRSRENPPALDVPPVPAPPRGRRVERAPLSPADLAWLAGLPADPAKVEPGDATHLAGLAAQAPPGTSDARLVAAKWQPVADHHARRRADVQAANARAQQPPPPPPSTIPAVAEAVRRANPDLTEAEATAQARVLLDGATGQATTRCETGGAAA